MEETEQKNESSTVDDALIKTTTRKDTETRVKQEQKVQKRRRQEPTSKDLKVVPGEKGLLKIKFENGGQLPKELNGTYTKELFAQRDIDKYLSKRGK